MEIKAPKKLLILLTCFGMNLSYPSQAVTWNDMKSLAIESSPAIKAAVAEVRSSNAAVSSIQSQFLPSVSSTISVNRNIETVRDQAKNYFDASIFVEQSIFSFGRSLAQLDAAKASKFSSESNLKLSNVKLRARLAKAWAKSLYYGELQKIHQKNILRREANFQIVKLRYKGGRENKGSLLKTEVATLQTQTDAQEAKANFDLSRGDLSVLVGRDLPPNEPLNGDLNSDHELTFASDNHDHPAVMALISKARAAEAAVNEASRRYFPELYLSATARKSASPNLPLEDPQYTVGVTLKFPIFDGKISSDVATSLAKQKSVEIALNDARATYKQLTKSAATSLEFAKKRLEASFKNFEASKLQAEVSRERYTLGLLSFQDWDSYESDLMRSEVATLTAKLDVANAVADYYESLGVTLEDGP